ncbi:MAG: hypothetical protein QXF04_01580 [Candidatus Aenigmatarchaeota archaeon]|uniref:Uncharacterized protein n=1 Tax=Pyrobaculum aerophilum (strain ATCC 51768 / DSM 7523 / JCM 9630 / CIP 104966 / NBRC 100827 / IM2) TaxID=178306 RepID=Q8ZZ13_PYRAE|nr:hypothetical protein PAE0496 [Pyrobaculum aerophilum str. IM2]
MRTLVRTTLASSAQYAVLLDADGQQSSDDIPVYKRVALIWLWATTLRRFIGRWGFT